MSGKVDDLYLPNAVILRIIRDALPDRTVVSREARSAISKSASSFILYVTSLASTHCEAAKRKTLAVGDIFAALKDMQFEHYILELQTFLEQYRARALQKKAAKRPPESSDEPAIAPETASIEQTEILEEDGQDTSTIDIVDDTEDLEPIRSSTISQTPSTSHQTVETDF
ncbi:DNA polymerase epsilon subunit 3 [Clonorchis sinensis]|uniref:DNA polymerase epsilon subunit 3 n=2 Tax=Clonorchis sinensis TaxID=79923 RepID=A0A8T1N017_CLOSI|nr:DNA polymerase epsilon subunit 3 [Clonorchis sinensis]GAA55526.1 DNA polymerase epsilon subunit 3 [Clonorchis sinensis]